MIRSPALRGPIQTSPGYPLKELASDASASMLPPTLRQGLIVSCQALADEPLHGSEIMAQMAVAAWRGGAAAIRANSGVDIRAISKVVPLPIIGIVKREYPDSPVYITATLAEAEEAIEAGAHILALDATPRPRPGGQSLERFVAEISRRWRIPLMADVSSVEEGIVAGRLGFDLVSTTLVGYAGDHEPLHYEPDFVLISRMVEAVSGPFGVPVVAEGHVWEPRQARRCLELGAYAVVVGSAITRPQLITERFMKTIRHVRTARD